MSACLKSMEWGVYCKKYIPILCIHGINSLSLQYVTIREIIFFREFGEFYHNLDERTQEKYDYAFNMIRTQYIVNKKFVKSLENTDFYELRISIGHNEYRSIMLAIDHDNFIQAHRVLVLNFF